MVLSTKNLADHALHKASASPDAVAIYLEDGAHIHFGSIFDEALALAASMALAMQLSRRKRIESSIRLPNGVKSQT